MQTEIYYRDITRTESLEDLLLEKVQGAVDEFLRYDSGAHLTVRVDTDRRRADARKPNFTCEVILKPSHTSVIKVKKTDENFNRCVMQTVAALKAIVRKKSSRRITRRRNRPSLGAMGMISQDLVA